MKRDAIDFGRDRVSALFRKLLIPTLLGTISISAVTAIDGIFVTMIPTLLFLNAHATELGLRSSTQFFFATGTLSSVLDNTPTALAFHTVAMGLADAPSMVAGVPEPILEAIATGAVFFGSMTYIGNGPNLMVKAIAEEHRIEMPSFFSYIFKFSLVVLLPIYIVVQWLFF